MPSIIICLNSNLFLFSHLPLSLPFPSDAPHQILPRIIL
jgi:hypothetical protein